MLVVRFLADTGTKPPSEGLGVELRHLLRKVQAGDVGARETLFATAYSDLERLARARLRDGGRSTLLDTRTGVLTSSPAATVPLQSRNLTRGSLNWPIDHISHWWHAG